MVSARTPISRQLAPGTLQPGRSGGAVNVGAAERLLSTLGGGALALFGMSRRSLPGLALAAVGGGLLYRGVTGHCPLYQTLGVSTATDHGRATSVDAGAGVRVELSLTIQRSPQDLYNYWRNFANLPRFMRNLRSVTVQGNRSHWTAVGPMNFSVEWDAEVINERPGELIAWRSLPGSQVDTAGSVHFRPAPGQRATEVRVNLKYDTPAGKAGALIAKLFGREPNQTIREDLRRFKMLMEAYETASTQG
jgi:uncharacterized membrane protein